jgi:hypothetical protein
MVAARRSMSVRSTIVTSRPPGRSTSIDWRPTGPPTVYHIP